MELLRLRGARRHGAAGDPRGLVVAVLLFLLQRQGFKPTTNSLAAITWRVRTINFFSLSPHSLLSTYSRLFLFKIIPEVCNMVHNTFCKFCKSPPNVVHSSSSRYHSQTPALFLYLDNCPNPFHSFLSSIVSLR